MANYCRAVMKSLRGTRLAIIKLFPAKERLVSDIPAREGKIANLFYSALQVKKSLYYLRLL
jgi:hypothetical protein